MFELLYYKTEAIHKWYKILHLYFLLTATSDWVSHLVQSYTMLFDVIIRVWWMVCSCAKRTILGVFLVTCQNGSCVGHKWISIYCTCIDYWFLLSTIYFTSDNKVSRQFFINIANGAIFNKLAVGWNCLEQLCWNECLSKCSYCDSFLLVQFVFDMCCAMYLELFNVLLSMVMWRAG